MTTPADTRTPRPAGARPTAVHRPAPWVRTRLRSGRLAALLVAALAFGTVLLAAAFPRALDRGTDDALHRFLQDRGPSWNSLVATAAHRNDAADLDEVARRLAARPGITFHYGEPGPVYGARGDKPRPLANHGYARPDGVPPKVGLMYLHGITDRATVVAGGWPADAGGQDGPIPVALSRNAADSIGIRLGDVLLGGEEGGDTVRAKVVGLYTVNDPHDPYWADAGCLDRACAQGNPHVTLVADGVVAAGALDRIAEWGVHTTDFWRLPVDSGALHARSLPETGREIAGYLSGPTAVALAAHTGRDDLSITSQLPTAFKQATARQNAAAPLAAIGPAGLAGVGALVLFLAAGLATDRRTAELRLLQARGGSRGGVLLRLLGEGAVTVLPAAAVATALALKLVETPRWTEAVLAALAVTLVALLGFPVRAATFWSKPRRRNGGRRLVGELLVLVATAAAVLEVRRRGVAPDGQGLDLLLVAAPLLLAATGGLVLARLQPVVVGALARVAGRRPGLIGFLGLARAARAARGSGGRARPSLLPLLAMTLAVTTAGFGATVLDAVDGARLRAARSVVGGDAAVGTPTGVSLPTQFTQAAAAMPGVRLATSVWWESEVFLLGSDAGPVRVSALVVDPQAYAELSRSVGRGAFDPALLAGGAGGPDAPLPALFSNALGKQLGGDGYRLRLPNGWELKAAVAGRIGATPALVGDDRKFVVLPSGPAVAQRSELGQPNLWFAVGDIDERQLKRLVRELAPPVAWRVAFGEHPGAVLPPVATGVEPSPASGAASAPGTSASASASTSAPASAPTSADGAAEADAVPNGFQVRTSATLAAEFAADPLQRSAGRLFWAAVIGAAGFALLAVLLTLVRTAPERAALLARLRTMGLRPRQGLALILAETVPQTLVAAVGGGLVALAATALLGPAFDLSVLVGAEVPPGLQPAVLPVLRQVLGLVALITVGVLAEALIAGRRHIATELRVGDQR
ncbi:hypothetical protein [Kitasatospora sp. NPDC090091]|uniref:hypothetical protein n=1 Tax=Kitasatospora sp. NPDC090091 TaxID=3364081 RepID=UPI00382CAC36